MTPRQSHEHYDFVTLLLLFILFLMIGKLWERRFWVQVVRYVNTRTAGMEGINVNAPAR